MVQVESPATQLIMVNIFNQIERIPCRTGLQINAKIVAKIVIVTIIMPWVRVRSRGYVLFDRRDRRSDEPGGVFEEIAKDLDR